MNKKSIIFDMDGTLIDSGNIIANTINHVRINSGLQKMPKDILLENINNPDINTAQFFYNVDKFTHKHNQLFETYYNEHCLSDIELYDGIDILLKNLKDKYILTIATNANTQFAIHMTKYLNIFKYFEDIVGADKVKNPKPNSDMLNLLINKYNFDRHNTILVGDSHKDLIAAKNANIKSLLVHWGFSKHKDNDAIHTIKQLEDILVNF